MTGWLAIGFVFYAVIGLLVTHGYYNAMKVVEADRVIDPQDARRARVVLVVGGVFWPAGILLAWWVARD